MKKENLLLLILLFTTLISCSQTKIEYNNIIITSDKCIEWNLPKLNITAKIPNSYKLSYNESGGFYLQVRKFDTEKKLLAEISIGRIEGELKDIHIMKALNDADKELTSQLENVEQINYKTTFIGEGLINGKNIKYLKGEIEFKDYQPTMNGKFYSFTTPIILDQTNKFMISAMFKEGEKFDTNKIGIELLDFMNSIKISE